MTKLGAPTQPGEPVADFAAQCSTATASCRIDCYGFGTGQSLCFTS
ncbi:hypothetical protein ACFVX6_38215 [Streptomyces sp. NPDC058289]